MNILGHDSQKTAVLVGQHAAVLGRVCMALLASQSEAEQALQDTLRAALNEPSGVRGEGALRAWLCGIARRNCAERLAARERALRQSSSAAPSAPAPGAPAPSADRPSMQQRARRLLGELRPTEREALVLRFTAELSFGELSQATGIDEATARKRVSRGLSRMRALLGEEKS